MKTRYFLFTGALAAVLAGFSSWHDGGWGWFALPPATASEAPDEIVDIRARSLNNPLAYLTSQCFTQTRDAADRVHNPCFSCHHPSHEANYIDDGDIQLGYNFPGLPGGELDNPWVNLFKDRTAAVAGIGDAAMLAYVRQDNYRGGDGAPLLARTLSQSFPVVWDANGNGRWDGYLPDAAFNFDADGFDRQAGGSYTGWRAFAYAPFLGTFWPTNGSTDDVLIRLAPAFWQTEQGQPDLTVYKTNLAIVTAMIQRRDVPLETPVDEAVLNVDLDKDGRLAAATLIRYDWAPLQGRVMSYVGRARLEQAAGKLHLAAGLFPEGTEFLHSVRYLDLDGQGGVRLSPRFKELRYAIKKSWHSYSDLKEMALKEVREKAVNPERTRQFTGNAETGLSNGQGWIYQGFIEDRRGRLRPQTYEETVFCIGCHSGIGATTDGVFAFPRKFTESVYQGGWYHWTQKSLAGTPEPLRRDGKPEYAHYLAQNGAADEFRENREAIQRFFDSGGKLKPGAAGQLRNDISTLLIPSQERAMILNKAYKTIVDEQSYALGRDATVKPAENVHRRVAIGTPTGVTEVVAGP